MVLLDPVVIQIAALTGFMAAAIAVGGFVLHAREAIAGASEERLRRLTALGGVGGLVVVAAVTALGIIV